MTKLKYKPTTMQEKEKKLQFKKKKKFMEMVLVKKGDQYQVELSLQGARIEMRV